jgi:hypothetical protein
MPFGGQSAFAVLSLLGERGDVDDISRASGCEQRQTVDADVARWPGVGESARWRRHESLGTSTWVPVCSSMTSHRVW